MITLPSTFPPSRRAPALQELDWLHHWLDVNVYDTDINMILEFGCGITSWVIDNAVVPDVYVAVEGYMPCVELVKKHCPNIKVITTDWDDIPKINYNIMFVDGSSLAPQRLKPIDDEMFSNNFIFRHDAIKYAEEFIADDCIVIVHDWDYKEGWKLPRKYLEANGYKLLDSLSGKGLYGMGIYQKEN